MTGSATDHHLPDETFDQVRLAHRADGSVATRALLDSRHPAAEIVIDYDQAGEAIARRELNLPGRPYARVDIAYGPDGVVTERTRSGFAQGDIASVTVRFDEHGAIAQVEHRLLDGSRTVVGAMPAEAGRSEGALPGIADLFVPLEFVGAAHATPFEQIASAALIPAESGAPAIDAAHLPAPGAHPIAPPDLIG